MLFSSSFSFLLFYQRRQAVFRLAGTACRVRGSAQAPPPIRLHIISRQFGAPDPGSAGTSRLISAGCWCALKYCDKVISVSARRQKMYRPNQAWKLARLLPYLDLSHIAAFAIGTPPSVPRLCSTAWVQHCAAVFRVKGRKEKKKQLYRNFFRVCLCWFVIHQGEFEAKMLQCRNWIIMRRVQPWTL